jgi:hypothetical protein
MQCSSRSKITLLFGYFTILELTKLKEDKKKQQNKVVYPIYVKYLYKGLSKKFSTNSFVELQQIKLINQNQQNSMKII